MKIKLISRDIKGAFIFHRFIYFKTFDFALAFEIFVSVCYGLLRPRCPLVYRCQMFFLNIQSIVFNCSGYESLGIKRQYPIIDIGINHIIWCPAPLDLGKFEIWSLRWLQLLALFEISQWSLERAMQMPIFHLMWIIVSVVKNRKGNYLRAAIIAIILPIKLLGITSP